MEQKSQQDHVKQQFSTNASAYLTSTTHANGPDLQTLLAFAQTHRPEYCLDLGTGAGHVSYTLAPVVSSIVAYDMSPAMIDIVASESSKRNLANIRTAVGIVEALPFADHSFDWVISRYSAHHWGNIPQALREVNRVLKPGGLCIIMDTIAAEQPLLDTFLQTIEILRDPTHIRNYRLSEWQAFFSNNGLSLIEFHRSKLTLEFQSWVERSQTPALNVQVLQNLLQAASPEIRAAFQLENSHKSFTVQKGFMVAQAQS